MGMHRQLSILILERRTILGNGYGTDSRADGTQKHEQNYLDQLFDNAQVGIVMAHNDGTIMRVNPEFTRIFGYTPEECMGKNVDALVTQGQDHKKAAGITQSVANGEKHAFEADRLCKDGTLKTVAVMASPIIMNGAQVAVYAFYRDISLQRQVEAELLKAKKLEATGALAAGIAHDFNNLLSVIMGNIDLVLLDTSTENTATKNTLTVAKNACVQAHKLTLKFLTFSSGGQPVKRMVDLKHLLRDTAEKVFTEAGITLHFDLADELALVQTDMDQMHHVFEGVMENALESIRDHGVVTISAVNLGQAECQGNLLLANDQQYVLVAIKDNGMGIPEESVHKVFDPYFSTKALAFRTGLGMGLTVAHSIVSQHGGHIQIDSQYRKGTTVKIYLPVN